MRTFVCILGIILMVVCSFYLTFNLCLVGGIAQIAGGGAENIAWGVVRILVSFPVFLLTLTGTVFGTIYLFDWHEER